ncbi:MAG TPA: phytanoyl-CoA dioxygenase family protein [Bryobacteraceae bacterium]|jgi:hypothetical protein
MSRCLLEQLENDGIAILPELVRGDTLVRMQEAFESRLRRLRWNNFDGYEKTERHRHMVQDVLLIEQGFVDVALHPFVKQTLRDYLGERFELVEAKGWKSMPTRRMFHGWHGDAWYDQSRVSYIPREAKLGLYLSDVRSGAFNYIKGTHGKQHPKGWTNREIDALDSSQIVTVVGPAGTAFLFDTSGIHGQGFPILEARNAVFFNYHDPAVPLQREDISYYRYHPLLLNPAFLGALDEEDRRILGFGNKTNYIHAFERAPQHAALQSVNRQALNLKIAADELASRFSARLTRLLGKN